MCVGKYTRTCVLVSILETCVLVSILEITERVPLTVKELVVLSQDMHYQSLIPNRFMLDSLYRVHLVETGLMARLVNLVLASLG